MSSQFILKDFNKKINWFLNGFYILSDFVRSKNQNKENQTVIQFK